MVDLDRLERVLVQVTAGSVRVGFGGGTPVDGVVRTASGTFVEELVARDHDVLRISADATFVGQVERVSVRRLA